MYLVWNPAELHSDQSPSSLSPAAKVVTSKNSKTPNVAFIFIKIKMGDFYKDYQDLFSRYRNLEVKHYSAYINSFSNPGPQRYAVEDLKLAKDYKSICRLLERVKNIVEGSAGPLLGSAELNTMLAFADIETFIQKYNLAPLIDSNHENYF
jgi:hypothetical protein